MTKKNFLPRSELLQVLPGVLTSMKDKNSKSYMRLNNLYKTRKFFDTFYPFLRKNRILSKNNPKYIILCEFLYTKHYIRSKL